MSTKKIVLILIASVAALAVGVGPRLAANSQDLATAPEAQGATIPYTGRLTDEEGAPVPEGAYAFTFALYAAESGGEPLWSEVQAGVEVTAGALSTALGAAEPIPPVVLASAPALWLAVGVRGPGESEFTVLSPRQALSAEAPAAPASTSNGMACPHDHLYEAWVGTDGMRTFSIANNGDGDGIWGTAQGSGAGVYGVSLNGSGVKGSSVNGLGVEGYSTSTSAWAPAVYGRHDGAGDGVYGVTFGRHGVYGVTKSTASDSAGVYARNDGGGDAIWSDGDLYADGSVRADGDLYVAGAFRGNVGSMGGAPFPRPAWESAWELMSTGSCVTLDHNLGSNPDSYFVDLQFSNESGRHNFGYGTAELDGWYYGGKYEHLTSNQITICRAPEDIEIWWMRVRIWIIQ
jgi:hypothetical protein